MVPGRLGSCKAIITLNVSEFPRFSGLAAKNVLARTVWAHLVKVHEAKSRFAGIFKWVCSLTLLETLLGLVIFLLWPLADFHGISKVMASQIHQARREAALLDWFQKGLRSDTVRAAQYMYLSTSSTRRVARYGISD